MWCESTIQATSNETPLPPIVFGNAQSLRKTMDELYTNIKYNCAYREACPPTLCETWLNSSIPDSEIYLDGYELLRADRSCDSGKSRGGGVCLYINKKWCTNYTVCDQVCTPDVKVLTLSLRPFYLPREFTNIIMCSGYVPPKAKCNSAADVIAGSVSRLQSLTQHHVTCPTRHKKTIDS